MCPTRVLYGAMAGGLLLLGRVVWFFTRRVHPEPVLLVAGTGFHGRSAKAVLPLLLYCFISLAILGIPAGLSIGKCFFPLNM